MASNTSPMRTPQSFAGILKDQEIFGTGRGDDAADQINSWFDDLMLQSGMAISPTMLLAVCLCSGLTIGGAAYVIQENLLSTALGTLIGFMLPVVVAMVVRTRRQDAMMSQVPSMLEELARAAKTGRSVEQSLELVSADTPSPLGDELKLVYPQQDGEPDCHAQGAIQDRHRWRDARLRPLRRRPHERRRGV